MPPFVLSCLTYLGIALPGSTLGILWPSMRVSLHEPVGALAIVLVAGVVASAISSTVTGRILSRAPAGPLLAGGAALVAAALAMETFAPALWLIAVGSAVFSAGFGAIDAALNAYAAGHFGARQINWMHAAFGLGATIGPLLVTGLLGAGAGWRFAVAVMAAVIGVITVVLAACRRAWDESTPRLRQECRQSASRGPRRRTRDVLSGVVFTAVETGVESTAGIWGYVFLTSGRGLSDTVAGVAVSAYWVMMFAGRALLGPVAERAGASRVLAAAVAGIPVGALLMAVPAPSFLAVAGMLFLGLAAAPVFPLITLTTADRVGAGSATAAVGLQVAASAVGSAALPSAVGLAIGAAGARSLGPALLVLGLAMCAVYRLLLRPAGARMPVGTGTSGLD
jgi:fucose permease